VPKMVWTPPDGEPRTYDFALEDLMWAEVRAIQKVTGASGLMAIGELLEHADGAIIPALLWVMRKREEPTLTFAELDDLRIREVTLEDDDKPEGDAKEAEPSKTPQTLPPPVEPPPHGVDLSSPPSQPMHQVI
jgi:hypothetical protein